MSVRTWEASAIREEAFRRHPFPPLTRLIQLLTLILVLHAWNAVDVKVVVGGKVLVELVRGQLLLHLIFKPCSQSVEGGSVERGSEWRLRVAPTYP